MAIRRGTAYRVPAFARAAGLLVLTNDEWNDAPTEELSGALVFADAAPGRTAVPDLGIWAGPLLAVPKDALADAMIELSAEQLRPVEDALCDVLGLRDLLASPPRSPSSLPGPVDYPRWSQIYSPGPPVGEPPERKRRVAVSHDAYDRAMGGAIFVRTTTSPKRGGRGIPTLQDGTTKALCVLPSFISGQSVAMRPGDRPQPGQLFLADMGAVAEGLVDALELSHAV